MMRFGRILATLVALAAAWPAVAQDPNAGLPPGYWGVEKTRPLLQTTGTIRLDPDLSGLSAGERVAVGKLLEAGRIFGRLFLQQYHPQAVSALAELQALDKRLGSPESTQNLLTLYRRAQGPIVSSPTDERGTMVPVDPQQPGRNLYPWGITKAEVEAYLAAHPEDTDAILGVRTVVRRAVPDNLRADLAQLAKYPVLDTLHPGLRAALEKRLAAADVKALYAVPYSLAYADEMIRAHALLNEAADAVQKDDAEFAGYLRNRSRDLLSNDYESGDAAWVTGRFKNLNAIIGAYETYEDGLFGTKAMIELSVLLTRRDETATLREALRGLQALEDSLPYAAHKPVRSDVPVGIYDVIAEFGDSQGTNTASILPNEAYLGRRYGRTIVLRANIQSDPAMVEADQSAWNAVVASRHRTDFTPRGEVDRTLWHEVGHYLGVDRTKDGRTLEAALHENHNTLEEMKADLVSLFVAEDLQKRGYYSAEQLRAVYAAGVWRTLNETKPTRDDSYGTMKLMQFNYFMQQGLIAFDKTMGTISVDYGKYHEVIAALLYEVLDIQYQGDKAASDAFLDRYAVWQDDLNGVLGKKMRAAQKYRRWLVNYTALGQ
jgi:hypothetical protein